MKLRDLIGRTLLLAALTTPVIIYVWVFGPRLSTDHTRWGEFGSAMAGIYTPILSLLTLAVLVMQVRLQAQMHAHDQTRFYIEQARSDIEFYVVRLDQAVQVTLSYGNTVRQILHARFARPEEDDFDNERLREVAETIDREAPQVLALLFAVHAILAGLSESNESQYRLNLSSASQKLSAMLSYETCVALEHFHRVRTEGRLRGIYLFSPRLSARG